MLLFHLLDGIRRFNELKRHVPDVTQRTVTNQLRELEADGLITREVYPVVPPKVEHTISDLGRSLAPILQALKQWGDANMQLFANTAS